MKAHEVTHNLLSHTLDHEVNGNINFSKNIMFPLLLVTFLIIIGRVPAIFENTGIDF